MGLTTLFAGWAWDSYNFLIAMQMQLSRVALILVGAYMIIFSRRAGIGVRSDGVIVRRRRGRPTALVQRYATVLGDVFQQVG